MQSSILLAILMSTLMLSFSSTASSRVKILKVTKETVDYSYDSGKNGDTCIITAFNHNRKVKVEKIYCKNYGKNMTNFGDEMSPFKLGCSCQKDIIIGLESNTNYTLELISLSRNDKIAFNVTTKEVKNSSISESEKNQFELEISQSNVGIMSLKVDFIPTGIQPTHFENKCFIGYKLDYISPKPHNAPDKRKSDKSQRFKKPKTTTHNKQKKSPLPRVPKNKNGYNQTKINRLNSDDYGIDPYEIVFTKNFNCSEQTYTINNLEKNKSYMFKVFSVDTLGSEWISKQIAGKAYHIETLAIQPNNLIYRYEINFKYNQQPDQCKPYLYTIDSKIDQFKPLKCIEVKDQQTNTHQQKRNINQSNEIENRTFSFVECTCSKGYVSLDEKLTDRQSIIFKDGLENPLQSMDLIINSNKHQYKKSISNNRPVSDNNDSTCKNFKNDSLDADKKNPVTITNNNFDKDSIDQSDASDNISEDEILDSSNFTTKNEPFKKFSTSFIIEASILGAVLLGIIVFTTVYLIRYKIIKRQAYNFKNTLQH